MHDATQPASPSTEPSGKSSPPDLTGQTVGDFRILRELGRGGMGHVYLAEQLSLKRKVALKFLRPDAAANPIALSRFRREAEAVARVTHANIVQVYSIGEAAGRHYMALEYVEGRNLKEYITRKGTPELPVALSIIRQVAAALQRASESGIVHRDIKPENILLTRKGEVKVADFGLSRDLTGEPELSLTQSGVTMGTPLYMSPEQAQGRPLDPRSDIYSFGVMCFHMFSGQPPFRGQSALEVALKHVNQEPPPLGESRPDLPPALVALVHRMMSKDPAARPQSGREVIRELTQPASAATPENPFAGMTLQQPSSGVMTPPAAETIAAAPAIRSRRPWRWVAVVASLLAAAAVGVGLRQLLNARSLPPIPPGDSLNLPVVSEQERRLLAGVLLYEAPTKPDKIRQGVGQHIELGVLYWEQKRYDDAAKLFEEMVSRPNAPPLYRTIGTFGLGVTYALRDEVDRSNKTFLEIKNLSAGYRAVMPERVIPPEDGINLRHWVLTALDRNATRPPLPKELEDVRKELRRPRNIGGAGKAG
jgi:tRNA A-37 threonylcarbamoyl transferase component Bud32